ncbi:hypothetical protein PLICRDRAFT_119390, partial [Plicaturopsis crispa FD-325 SS-3]
LDLDRCLEEELRIAKERSAMQEWMLEEWQLNLREAYLRRLCVTWQGAVRPIPCGSTMPESWGPSLEDLVDTAILENTASYLESEDEDDGNYAGYGEMDEEEDDAELLDVAEETALRDAYKLDGRSVAERLGFDALDNLSSSPIKGSSSRKRRRYE